MSNLLYATEFIEIFRETIYREADQLLPNYENFKYWLKYGQKPMVEYINLSCSTQLCYFVNSHVQFHIKINNGRTDHFENYYQSYLLKENIIKIPVKHSQEIEDNLLTIHDLITDFVIRRYFLHYQEIERRRVDYDWVDQVKTRNCHLTFDRQTQCTDNCKLHDTQRKFFLNTSENNYPMW